MVDWSKIKREYIPEAEVPTERLRGTDWDTVFGNIPEDQALVVKEPEVCLSTIRIALSRKQKEGKFKNYRVISKGRHGVGTIYIVNIKES